MSELNCEQFLQLLLENPYREEEGFNQHRKSCVTCNEEYQKVHHLERDLYRATQVQEPGYLSDQILTAAGMLQLRTRNKHLRWAAFGVLAVIALASFTLLVARSGFKEGQPIAPQIVEHIEHEPKSFKKEALSDEDLVNALADNNALLVEPLGKASYIASCRFGSNMGLHLVMYEGKSPITVILIPGHTVVRSEKFSFNGFFGEVVPLPDGTLAVVSKQESQVGIMLQRLRESLVWQGTG